MPIGGPFVSARVPEDPNELRAGELQGARAVLCALAGMAADESASAAINSLISRLLF